jgi:pimeloyl-ACP methyl ester carboxylesterase
MKLHHKIGHWLVDYLHMARGGVLMFLHEEPPKHYLGYVVEGKVPIFLIPGILEKWGIMKNLGDKISLAGYPVYIVPHLKYNLYSIPKAARIFKSFVTYLISKLKREKFTISSHSSEVHKLIEKHNLKNVILVTHSKGGLIGKYLLIHHNEDHRIKGLVAIAAPFSGSGLAKLILHDSYQELSEDSKIINDLSEHKEVNHQIISIYPKYDNYVWSNQGSFLEGAENIEVNVYGHNKILFSKETEKKVLESIEKLSKE